MAITPVEMVVIAVVLIVFVMWGPKKIPELARSIGRARKEFNEGIKEGALAKDSTEEPASSDALLDTARKLGISTEGKSREQVSQAIVEKAQKTG